MSDPPQPLGDLPRQLLDTYRDEYKEVSETWRLLDTKAQGTGAIAGIFLAAAFAWARELPGSFGCGERSLLIASIVLLVLTVGASVAAMQVRTVSAPPLGDETSEMIADIERAGASEERLRRFYRDQATAWKDTVSELAKVAQRKATWLLIAQVALLVAAAVAAALTIIAVLRH